MTMELNLTHDAQRRSFVESANVDSTDFPIQNLPFGVFEDAKGARGGVALGDSIIDLSRLIEDGAFGGPAAEAALAAAQPDLTGLFEAPAASVSALRSALSDLYRRDTDRRGMAEGALLPASSVTMKMPAKPAAFTDFCTSADHILRMAKYGGRPAQPAWATLPVAYNGRASSVEVSGTPVVRPMGQVVPKGSSEMQFAAEPMLDFELEFGAWLRGPGNPLGEPIDMARAEDLLFGCCLVNDWSARAIQFYEMILGPHLGKSFLTTISPWIVTMEALAPFRVPGRGRTTDEPAIPDYLNAPYDRQSGGLNVELTAEIDVGTGPQQIVRTNAAELFWTLAQMLTHQASNGAPLEVADLIATGTVSGAADEARACLVELTSLGQEPLELEGGVTRTALEDGDILSLRGRAMAEGYVPIGFGECSGTITPARKMA
ncbi:fumarylacetoacetate hydrolase family protein [Altericroceibacterium endophyticum]|uniref:fumarylacetoacetase n=1 Tax=Altericroceibacterium endophyticum TaxID=1808508 RepID=A0A6I4T953_9SPHN|nr:fumarylacetoacetate hydrolase family protein [Altericroceibacterium endophyticum]MXO66400.1 fumarylacetoacetase [Altericroceibacterium endophyticum]